MRGRDNQRKRLYDAETVARNCADFTQGKFEDTEGVQKYVNMVLKSLYLKRKYRLPPYIEVVCTAGNHAERHGRKISINKSGRTEAIVLHEVAHCLVSYQRYADVAAHGWQFASIFLDLLRHFLGQKQHDVMKMQFKIHRVKFKQPRPKRQLTDEQRRILVERMAEARKHLSQRSLVGKAPSS